MRHAKFTGPMMRFIAHFGTVRAAAKAVGCNPCTIHRWQNKGMPASAAYRIETATGGAVKASDFE